MINRSVDVQHTRNWVDFAVGYMYCSVEGLIIVPAHFQVSNVVSIGTIELLRYGHMQVLGYCQLRTLDTESDLGLH